MTALAERTSIWIPTGNTIELPLRKNNNIVELFGNTTESLSVLGNLYKYPNSQEGTTVMSIQIERFLEWLYQKNVLIPKPIEVRKYLNCFPNIITDVLIPTIGDSVEHFGYDSQLSFELYHDPEIDDQYLALYIRKKEYSEKFIEEIRDIRSRYSDRLTGKAGWFLLTTDFHCPVR